MQVTNLSNLIRKCFIMDIKLNSHYRKDKPAFWCYQQLYRQKKLVSSKILTRRWDQETVWNWPNWSQWIFGWTAQKCFKIFFPRYNLFKFALYWCCQLLKNVHILLLGRPWTNLKLNDQTDTISASASICAKKQKMKREWQARSVKQNFSPDF